MILASPRTGLLLRNPVILPRGDVVELAIAERDSLWRRAASSGRCARHWRRAAQNANEAVRYLRRGDDLAAIARMSSVADDWRQAYSCEQAPMAMDGLRHASRAKWIVGAVTAWLLLR